MKSTFLPPTHSAGFGHGQTNFPLGGQDEDGFENEEIVPAATYNKIAALAVPSLRFHDS